MGAFVDKMLVRLCTPDGLRELVFPPADTDRQHVRALFAAVYHLPFAVVHDVTDVQVVAVDSQRPLFPPLRRSGTWTQVVPSHTRMDFTVEGSNGERPQWVDVSAELTVTAALLVDPAEVESIRVADLGEFATIEEFRQRFEIFDVDAFMAEHGLSTVEDLRRAFRYVLTELRLKPAPPPEPEHLTSRRFRLRVAVLIREVLDVAGALRDMRLVLAAAEHAVSYAREVDSAEVRAPYAPLLVFPAAAVTGDGPTEAQIAEFFASQQMLAVFTES